MCPNVFGSACSVLAITLVKPSTPPREKDFAFLSAPWFRYLTQYFCISPFSYCYKEIPETG